MDREKIIKGLDALSKAMHENQCYTCSHEFVEVTHEFGTNIIEDTLALLKEQEARILDWDELEDWANAVWFEDKDEHECYIALIANVGTYDAKFVNVEPGMVHRLDFLREFYKKEWRCWSARPTIKQRQAMKWE